MEKQINKLEGTEQELQVTLSNEELKPYYEAAYKKAQPEIDLKGFRKGKVPIKLIKQYFGKRIELEAHEEIVSDVFAKAAQEEELRIIGQPHLHDIKMLDDGIIFAIRYDTPPDTELKDYKSLEIDEPVHSVSDEEVLEEIDKLRTHNGTFEISDRVTDEQFVVGVNLREIDPDTRVPVIGGKSEDLNIYLADQTVLPELRHSIINTKIGDKFIFNPSEHDHNAPDTLYEVSVNDIQRLIPREFNDEFVKEYTQGKFDNTEDFKAEIGFRLQEEWDRKSRQAMETQVIDRIVDMHEDMPLPQSVVDQVIDSMIEDLRRRYQHNPEAAKTITRETMGESIKPVAERQVKWELLRNMIIEKEQIEVEDHDIEEIVQAEAERTKSDPEALRKRIRDNQNIMSNILLKKVMDLLLDFAVTNEVEFDEHGHYHSDSGGHHHHDHEYDEDDHEYDEDDHE
ncbi:MAG: trigger factor, partial [Candidatus Kapaibacterium sp.]